MTSTAKTVRIAAAQTPEFREDAASALAFLSVTMEKAYHQGAALLCLPEGFLQGYLTENDAARRNAVDLGSAQFGRLLAQLPAEAPMTVVGLLEAEGEDLFNTAVVVHRQALVGRYRKRHLLGGERCFRAGDDTPIFEVDGLRFGINICFDTNFADGVMSIAEQGATLMLCPANNMLPERIATDWKDRHNAVRAERCREGGIWLVSADVTGSRDGRVGWGPTAVLNPAGEVVAQLPLDAPGLLVFDMPLRRPT
jgi:predicted amidohydrolase